MWFERHLITVIAFCHLSRGMERNFFYNHCCDFIFCKLGNNEIPSIKFHKYPFPSTVLQFLHMYRWMDWPGSSNKCFAGMQLCTLESNSSNVTNNSTEKQQRKILPPSSRSRLRTNTASLDFFVVQILALTFLPSELLCVF
jgi:hypothetical protein